jgi:predicted tellurium resistance membrane protein TerC
MGWISSPESWTALVSLTVLEIVLGIDNIVFISILAGKLAARQQSRARTLGLALAMITRVLLLLSLTLIMRLTAPLFAVLGREISGRDLILLAGGVFLIWKSTHEIHQRTEGESAVQRTTRGAATMGGVLAQIALVDLVFSLDSVITAVGMANEVPIMIAAIMLAVGFMIFAAGPVSGFVERHPTVKMLALSFLLLIGVTLIAEGLGQHISKGYVYFAMAFSLLVELLNLRARKRHGPQKDGGSGKHSGVCDVQDHGAQARRPTPLKKRTPPGPAVHLEDGCKRLWNE